MAYSFMTAISDGTLKSMPITFNYMREDDIVVHQNITRLTKGIDYTINNNIITFAKVIPALNRIAVDRMSQRDALRVDFTEGATFSRDNIDDVLTQLLYLTQEAVEGSVDRISPTGVLDLAGNRIINLGDPVDLQDAVPLHLVVDAEKSVYASEAKCKQYRDEALGYKNEAFTYADRAYASELNAKKSEDNAKASEINAANSAASILGAVEKSAESAAAAKVSETNAKASENKTEAMVDRVEDALVAVEEYDDRLIAVENGKLSTTGGTMTGALSIQNVGDFNVAGVAPFGKTHDVFRVGVDDLRMILACKDKQLTVRGEDGTESYVYHQDLRPSAAEVGAISVNNIIGGKGSGALFESWKGNRFNWTKLPNGLTIGTYTSGQFGAATSASGHVSLGEIEYDGEVFSSTPCITITVRDYTSSGHPWTYKSEQPTTRSTGKPVLHCTAANSSRQISITIVVTGFLSDTLTLEEPPVQDQAGDFPQVLPYDLGVYKKEY